VGYFRAGISRNSEGRAQFLRGSVLWKADLRKAATVTKHYGVLGIRLKIFSERSVLNDSWY
jgi:hypothetical protein